MIKVNFVSQGGVNLASHRMRVQKPCKLLNTYVDDIEATINPLGRSDAHVNIFNKHFDQKNNLAACAAGNQMGYYTVFDICDDWFEREHDPYYKAMCQHSDLITCNTENMCERILEVTGKDAIVIPDPFTFPSRKPKKHKKDAIPKILWFGHGSNVQSVLDWVEHLDDGYRVTVITNVPVVHPKVDFIPWEPGRVEHEIGKFDIVLVPTKDTPWTKCKSPNRVVDALVSGKSVIADNEEVYGNFKDFIQFISSGDKLMDAIEWWQQNPEEEHERVSKGCKYVKKHYSEEVVLDRWLDALKALGAVKTWKKV